MSNTGKRRIVEGTGYALSTEQENEEFRNSPEGRRCQEEFDRLVEGDLRCSNDFTPPPPSRTVYRFRFRLW